MFLHDFLSLIRDRMLVVDSKKRDSCENIGRDLKGMLDKCRQDKAYAVQSNPWCDRPALVSHPIRLSMTPDAERTIQENLPRQRSALLQTQEKSTSHRTDTTRHPPSRIPVASFRLRRPSVHGFQSPIQHP